MLHFAKDIISLVLLNLFKFSSLHCLIYHNVNLFIDAYDSRHLKYSWKNSPGVIIKDKRMAQFELTKYNTVGAELAYVAGLYSTFSKGKLPIIVQIISLVHVFQLFIRYCYTLTSFVWSGKSKVDQNDLFFKIRFL